MDALTRIALLLAALLPLLLLWLLSIESPRVEARRAQLIVETASVPELIADSPAMDLLARSGVGGILVQPSTLAGLLTGRDVTMASGAEILRLFRMESILNIWMWAEVKKKPIRLDATYIMTHHLILFDHLNVALREHLGDARVRSYRDESHDFGGQIPGNYIIEILAQPEELLSLTIGLDKTWRDSLMAAGLMPVMVAARVEDIAGMPREMPAIYVTDAAAAAEAFAKVRPARVFLAPGIRNPGWSQARVAARYQGMSADADADILVCGVEDVPRAAAILKQRGYSLGPAPVQARSGESILRAEAERVWWLTQAADFLLAFGAASFTWIVAGGSSHRVRFFWTALTGTAALSPLFPFAAALAAPGLAASIIAALAPVVAVQTIARSTGRNRADTSELNPGFAREYAVWRVVIAFALLLLASMTRSATGHLPPPSTIACGALAVLAILEAPRRGVDLYTLAAVAVTTGGLLPTHSWTLTAIAVGAGLLFSSHSAPRASIAAALVAWPAAFAAALDPTRPFEFRLFLLATASLASLIPSLISSPSPPRHSR